MIYAFIILIIVSVVELVYILMLRATVVHLRIKSELLQAGQYSTVIEQLKNGYSRSTTNLMSERQVHTKKEMLVIQQNAKKELMETYIKLYGKR